jgi:glycerol kinase
MPGGYVVTIDQGTTSTKVLIVNADARVCGSASREFTQYYPRSGWVEHDPEEIWQSVVAALHAAIVDAGVSINDVAAIGLTNQRETTVLWDRRTGRSVHPAIVWHDRRTAEICNDLSSPEVDDLIRSRTGLRLDSYFSATKVAWILDHVDGLRERAQRGEIAFGTIDSWLLFKLTGGRIHATDATNASRTLLMDLLTTSWDDELCQLLQVPSQVLAPIERSEFFFGESDPSVLGRAVAITAMIGDQQSALFAQGCHRAGQTKNTYGTGSFVLQHTGAVVVDHAPSLVATVAYTGKADETQYALEGSIFVTGAAIQWLRDGLGIIDNAQETEQIVRGLSDNGDVWFVPALTGLGAPHWDPHARGLLVGMSRGTTSAHLVRAALESIAYQTRDVIDEMNLHSLQPLSELRVDGGASHNGWLMQFQADVLGVPVVVAESSEATALGAAYAAGIGAGIWKRDDVFKQSSRDAQRYEPTMSKDQRDALFQRWRRALEYSKGWAS